MPYGLFTYVVQYHRIVLPTALWVTHNVGYERLVLSACNPLYSAAQRIIIFARLKSVTPLGPARQAWISGAAYGGVRGTGRRQARAASWHASPPQPEAVACDVVTGWTSSPRTATIRCCAIGDGCRGRAIQATLGSRPDREPPRSGRSLK